MNRNFILTVTTVEYMNMANVAGGMAALVALFAGLFAKVDPVLCLERATLAFVLGWVCGQVWHLLIGAVSPASTKLGRVEQETVQRSPVSAPAARTNEEN